MPDPKQPLPESNGPRPRSILPVIILLSAVLLGIFFFNDQNEKKRSWSEFKTLVQDGQITKVTIEKGSILAETKNGEEVSNYRVNYPGAKLTEVERQWLNEEEERLAAEGHIMILNGDAPESALGGFLIQILFFGGLIAIMYFLFFRRMGGGGGVLSFGKSRATLIDKDSSGKTFKDVAGIEEAKEEVHELVDFLSNPEKFQRLGGRIPRGVMLVGQPGTGKTLLAKAIAGEADVPFYSISGSDFVEMFVGVGASRVRDLFQQAKENSPCIIFIDEIDAVARKRGVGGATGGHDEREQTLNAILVEMDGFSSKDNVIVMAATNRVDVLDPAILRPGRFDRHIYVDLPDIKGREEILQVHGKKVKLDANVDLGVVARATPGFSGADLENLMNEAALNAARCEQDSVIHNDLEYARDRVAFGREKGSRNKTMPQHEKRLTAYHEAGHVIIQHLLPEVDDLHKVSIIPRGRALGLTMGLPKERYSQTRQELLGEMCLFYGGRIAEDRFCEDITTGASNDIERATALARGMVYEWGMSDTMGPIKYTEQQTGLGGEESVIVVSEETRRELDKEVRDIIDAQYKRAENIIDENKDAIIRIAEALLEWETITAEQVETLVQGGDIGNRPSAITDTDDTPEADTSSEPQSAAAAQPPINETGFKPSLA